MLKEVLVPVAFPLQPVKVYPLFGVAVIVTEVPSAYSPPEVLTVPPFVADTDKLYEVVVDSVEVVSVSVSVVVVSVSVSVSVVVVSVSVSVFCGCSFCFCG